MRAVIILALVLLGIFAWRAWKPMPNLALFVAVVAGGGALFMLRSPYALVLTALLAGGFVWVIRKNDG
ncbi:MAG: hypothetical protein ACO1SX_28745 [Actinomycetota bacterium]